LVLTRSRNEYKETSATTVIVTEENKRPPLAKLKGRSQDVERRPVSKYLRLPEKQDSGTNERFQKLWKITLAKPFTQNK
jgi:hypothetical protein